MSSTKGNVVYTAISGTVVVTGFVGVPTDIEILNNVIINSISYNVTSIGDGAFSQCSSLTSITIPNSVTSIGGGAFQFCSSLKSITIPNSVTSIGGGAFYQCSSLTSITIPNSVTSIGDGAFSKCSSLKSITIPNSVTSIRGGAFYQCSSLTSITIPNSVTSIGNDAFYRCSSLTSITIPNSVTSIGGSAFYRCSSLTSITIPNSVTSIGNDAFYQCSSLTSITIPNSVTSIGYGAFGNCPSLKSVIIKNPSLIALISDNSFTNVSSDPNSNITFLNTTSFNSLSNTWKTISSYYANKRVYTTDKIPTIITGVSETIPKTYGNVPFYLTYSSYNLSQPTYLSSVPSVATIDTSGLVTILSVGKTTLTISLPETDTYAAGTATCALSIESNTSSNPVDISSTYGLEYFLTETPAGYGEISVPSLQVTTLVNSENSWKQITSTQKCILYS